MREDGRIVLPVKRQVQTENVEKMELANNHFSVIERLVQTSTINSAKSSGKFLLNSSCLKVSPLDCLLITRNTMAIIQHRVEHLDWVQKLTSSLRTDGHQSLKMQCFDKNTSLMKKPSQGIFEVQLPW